MVVTAGAAAILMRSIVAAGAGVELPLLAIAFIDDRRIVLPAELALAPGKHAERQHRHDQSSHIGSFPLRARV
jgi:hypothetical protein